MMAFAQLLVPRQQTMTTLPPATATRPRRNEDKIPDGRNVRDNGFAVASRSSAEQEADSAAAAAAAVPTNVTHNSEPCKPRRFIYSDDDLQRFLQSPAKRELMQVTAAMGKACATCSMEENEEREYDPSEPLVGLCPPLASLLGSLREIERWIEQDFPPEPQSAARFGNPAFRRWHAQLVYRAPAIVRCILKHQRQQSTNDPFAEYHLEELKSAATEGELAAQQQHDASDPGDGSSQDDVNDDDDDDDAVVTELCAYLEASFGHPIRLDFGTGHECSFQVFLFALMKLGCFGSTSERPPTLQRLRAATLALYGAYLSLCRKLQTVYRLEPAGSHGVWGLDDFHCLPFYFGACQLQTQDEITPRSIHDDSILNREGGTYLYLGCIRYIKSVKKGAPFFESQPMLNDISQLSSWQKVSSGLLKLFEGEVLSKRQVVQHLVFGNIFAANWNTNEDPSPSMPRLPPDSLFVGVGSGVGTGVGLGAAAARRPPPPPHSHLNNEFEEDHVL